MTIQPVPSPVSPFRPGFLLRSASRSHHPVRLSAVQVLPPDLLLLYLSFRYSGSVPALPVPSPVSPFRPGFLLRSASRSHHPVRISAVQVPQPDLLLLYFSCRCSGSVPALPVPSPVSPFRPGFLLRSASRSHHPVRISAVQVPQPDLLLLYLSFRYSGSVPALPVPSPVSPFRPGFLLRSASRSHHPVRISAVQVPQPDLLLLYFSCRCSGSVPALPVPSPVSPFRPGFLLRSASRSHHPVRISAVQVPQPDLLLLYLSFRYSGSVPALPVPSPVSPFRPGFLLRSASRSHHPVRISAVQVPQPDLLLLYFSFRCSGSVPALPVPSPVSPFRPGFLLRSASRSHHPVRISAVQVPQPDLLLLYLSFRYSGSVPALPVPSPVSPFRPGFLLRSASRSRHPVRLSAVQVLPPDLLSLYLSFRYSGSVPALPVPSPVSPFRPGFLLRSVSRSRRQARLLAVQVLPPDLLPSHPVLGCFGSVPPQTGFSTGRSSGVPARTTMHGCAPHRAPISAARFPLLKHRMFFPFLQQPHQGFS